MKNQNIESLTDVKKESYCAILEEVMCTTTKVTDRIEASFHFIKYHDCLNREGDFLKILRDHSIYYCFPKERYEGKSVSEISGLTFEARDKFFNPSDPNKSGEFGEVALYFLLESYLKAPQIVSKMSLKTTGQKNYNGSDGIHFGIYQKKKCLFYCESKLNKKRDEAFKRCLASVLEFQKEKKDFEVSIIKSNIDMHDEELREAILDFLDHSKEKKPDFIEVNACFVGYDWNKFGEVEKKSDNDSLHTKLMEELRKDIEEVKPLLTSLIKDKGIRQRFYFFVIPFKDVEKLRKEFLELLYGRQKEVNI